MGQIFAVVSGKGGTGKTSLCAAVACCLAAEGAQVLCIDADVGLRNLDIALGLSELAAVPFTEFLDGRSDLSAIPEHPALPGLYLLTAPVSRAPEEIDLASYQSLLERLRSRFDYCLIDAPGGGRRRVPPRLLRRRPGAGGGDRGTLVPPGRRLCGGAALRLSQRQRQAGGQPGDPEDVREDEYDGGRPDGRRRAAASRRCAGRPQRHPGRRRRAAADPLQREKSVQGLPEYCPPPPRPCRAADEDPLTFPKRREAK